MKLMGIMLSILPVYIELVFEDCIGPSSRPSGKIWKRMYGFVSNMEILDRSESFSHLTGVYLCFKQYYMFYPLMLGQRYKVLLFGRIDHSLYFFQTASRMIHVDIRSADQTARVHRLIRAFACEGSDQPMDARSLISASDVHVNHATSCLEKVQTMINSPKQKHFVPLSQHQGIKHIVLFEAEVYSGQM